VKTNGGSTEESLASCRKCRSGLRWGKNNATIGGGGRKHESYGSWRGVILGAGMTSLGEYRCLKCYCRRDLFKVGKGWESHKKLHIGEGYPRICHGTGFLPHQIRELGRIESYIQRKGGSKKRKKTLLPGTRKIIRGKLLWRYRKGGRVNRGGGLMC